MLNLPYKIDIASCKLQNIKGLRDGQILAKIVRSVKCENSETVKCAEVNNTDQTVTSYVFLVTETVNFLKPEKVAEVVIIYFKTM